MGNTLIVNGSGPTKEAALQDVQRKLTGLAVRQFAFQSQEYDAGSGRWWALAIAVVDENLPEGTCLADIAAKRPGILARLFKRGGNND